MTTTNTYRSFFSLKASATVNEENYILFYRSNKGWNDFGYKFKVVVENVEKGREVLLSIRINVATSSHFNIAT